MRLTTPSFWHPDSENGKKCHGSEIALTPFAFFYQLLHKLNMALKNPYNPAIPVICIGNITIGGSGKTPVAISVMKMLNAKKMVKAPFFLSRGYGGLISTATLIDTELHDHTDVGDEAMILQKHGPIITAKNRKKGAKLAALNGCDCLIMDDGMQNNSLQKSITFCVIDGESGLGNGKTFPAGPLREKTQNGFDKSDAFILIGTDKHNIKSTLPIDKPVFCATLEPTTKPEATKERYVAFAGIGRPEKFKTTLEAYNMEVAEFMPFPDHHPYNKSDLTKLEAIAKKHNATLLTTEKDIVRLPQYFVTKHNVQTLPVTIKWSDQKSIEAFLKDHLASYNKAA